MRGERSRQASGGRGALTQHADEGVGQQVAVLVGGVALVHGPAADRSVKANTCQVYKYQEMALVSKGTVS